MIVSAAAQSEVFGTAKNDTRDPPTVQVTSGPPGPSTFVSAVARAHATATVGAFSAVCLPPRTAHGVWPTDALNAHDGSVLMTAATDRPNAATVLWAASSFVSTPRKTASDRPRSRHCIAAKRSKEPAALDVCIARTSTMAVAAAVSFGVAATCAGRMWVRRIFCSSRRTSSCSNGNGVGGACVSDNALGVDAPRREPAQTW